MLAQLVRSIAFVLIFAHFTAASAEAGGWNSDPHKSKAQSLAAQPPAPRLPPPPFPSPSLNNIYV